MLKLHQLFSINFTLVFLGTFGFLVFFTYQNHQERELAVVEQKLRTMIEIVDISILEGSISYEFTRDLARRTGTYIVIFNKALGTFTASHEDAVNMDIFLGIDSSKRPLGGERLKIDRIEDKEVMYLAQDTVIDDRGYIIAISLPIEGAKSPLYELWWKIAPLFLVSLLLSFVVARLIERNINFELRKITLYLREVAEKNYQATLSGSFIGEFAVLSELLTNLARKLEKKDRKTRKQAAKLRLKNRQNADIISAISHEFKNPIAIIIGYCETLLGEESLPEEKRRRFLERISHNAQKLSTLIDRLRLTFSLENDIARIEPTRFCLKSLALEIAKSLEEKHKRREIEVVGEAREVEADKTLMEHVIHNLAENALKYSSDKVTIEVAPKALWVVDRGVGLEESELKLITKKFYRVDSHSWESSLGLGLSIVKYILKLHGKNLQIESELGKGSKFGFEI
ncbi:sensor histidine kinase [Wolinella succinogenes]|uniref:histidine kinase n=1 Tax=Wolinella succinogenes (strain ATCC 29543 / DSM 1740 / CCUG 13145 / JCM 31913 / LMG 7466 / NCTC 11488 / FDC 602W) TaxID=273121 RepID=Q7M9F7_WOLSU|nr:HAMP domain-containing sensor histidine kinase [Wolinella succinogenes]CAE10055.1 SENSORY TRASNDUCTION HISTIDINE KINASE [Wolinella succinogenes]VEG82266.1 Alkaline phosphatase synthesis sensor protein phoR [Wolinella succinogenes]HCZ19543.1 sensor histidine kinase [Helicobacter sp.]